MTLLLAALYAFSPLSEELYRGDFIRDFKLEGGITQLANLETDESNLYISGADDKNIYLSSYRTPFLVRILSTDLKSSERVGIKLNGIDSLIEPRQFRTKVQPPYFVISNGVIPIVMKGNIHTWEATTLTKSNNKYYFDDVTPISENTAILRSYSTYHKQSDLARLTVIDTPEFKFKFDLLKKQTDGLIDVSGNLLYDNAKNKLVYVYAYRNEFFSMDTSLNLLNTMHTIDTFKTVQIKLSNTQPGTSMVEGSSISTNVKSSAYNNLVFIQSNILSKDEEEMKFRQSSAIDIYDIEGGEYLKSFYIPNHKNQKLVDFRMVNNKLIALFDDHVVVYKIETSRLNQTKAIL
jgi:hypothetical protein